MLIFLRNHLIITIRFLIWLYEGKKYQRLYNPIFISGIIRFQQSYHFIMRLMKLHLNHLNLLFMEFLISLIIILSFNSNLYNLIFMLKFSFFE